MYRKRNAKSEEEMWFGEIGLYKSEESTRVWITNRGSGESESRVNWNVTNNGEKIRGMPPKEGIWGEKGRLANAKSIIWLNLCQD